MGQDQNAPVENLLHTNFADYIFICLQETSPVVMVTLCPNDKFVAMVVR